MQPKLLLTALLTALLFLAATAQNAFKSIGKQGKVLTLTKGKYAEQFDTDSIQQIGNALINIYSQKVVKLLTDEEAEDRLDNATSSRFLSVDPITNKYPELTPYQFASNTPIQAIDIDGLEKYIVTKELYSNGDTRSITIFYTINKDDLKSLVDMKFKQIIGKNTNGTELLSNSYLMGQGQDVIRIIRDANGNESYKKDTKLNKQEQAIVNNHSQTDRPIEPDKNEWTLTLGKKVYAAEPTRDVTKMIDKTAFKQFKSPIIKNAEENQEWVQFANGNGASTVGNYALANINKIVKNFTEINKNVENIKVIVTITTLTSNKAFAQVLAGKLSSIGITSNIVLDDKYKSATPIVPNAYNSAQDYTYKVAVSGTLTK